MSLKNRHLLGLEGYPAEDIQTIIDTAFTFREVLDRPIKKVQIGRASCRERV